jgi:hypothetical protein
MHKLTGRNQERLKAVGMTAFGAFRLGRSSTASLVPRRRL